MFIEIFVKKKLRVLSVDCCMKWKKVGVGLEFMVYFRNGGFSYIVVEVRLGGLFFVVMFVFFYFINIILFVILMRILF